MFARAQMSDAGTETMVHVAALARPTGTAPVRYQPANDTGADKRFDLLVRRRRRQGRLELRS